MVTAHINLEANPYEINEITALNICNKINEHSTLVMKAQLTGERGHHGSFIGNEENLTSV